MGPFELRAGRRRRPRPFPRDSGNARNEARLAPGSRRVAAGCWSAPPADAAVPYLRAALEPPPGREFVGAFHWIDDFYHYASYDIQQSEDGRFLFENKLGARGPPRSGLRQSRVVDRGKGRVAGRSPPLRRLPPPRPGGVRRVALGAGSGRSAMPVCLRLIGSPACSWSASGGGLGGLLFEFTSRSAFRSVDMSVGLFPFLEVLANPHWLAGTWLLLESILAFAHAAPSGGKMLPAILLGTALGTGAPLRLRPPRPRATRSTCRSLSRAAGGLVPGRWLRDGGPRPRRALQLLGLLHRARVRELCRHGLRDAGHRGFRARARPCPRPGPPGRARPDGRRRPSRRDPPPDAGCGRALEPAS